MTEAEWLDVPDWLPQFRHLGGRVSPRKLRLLAAGFCRLAWHLFDHPDCRAAVEVTERFAEGRATVAELEDCKQRCRVVYVRAGEEYNLASERDPAESSRAWVRQEVGWAAFYAATGQLDVNLVAVRTLDAAVGAETAHGGMLPWTDPGRNAPLRERYRLRQRGVLFDLFDNPFRPGEFDPDWRTSTAVALARSVDVSGDFSALPILADALQDAGCEDAAVLDHCRDAGPHYRGCRVVDAVLGKR